MMLTALPLTRIAVAESYLPSDRLDFEGLIRQRESAQAIGYRFLNTYPDEANVSWLRESLQAGLGITDGQGITPECLGEMFRQRCALDFEEDRIEKLNSCWFSVSELRLCALIAMLEV